MVKGCWGEVARTWVQPLLLSLATCCVLGRGKEVTRRPT